MHLLYVPGQGLSYTMRSNVFYLTFTEVQHRFIYALQPLFFTDRGGTIAQGP